MSIPTHKIDHDTAINMLTNKICPVHKCEMPYERSIIIADYERKKYKCPKCMCRVDYVEDEPKPDAIGATMYVLVRDGLIDGVKLKSVGD